MTDLAANQTVTFRNVKFHHSHGQQPRLELVDCDGTVQLHGCHFVVENRSLLGRRAILEIVDSVNVRMDSCIVDGSGSFRPGALIERSRLTATRPRARWINSIASTWIRSS